jgi:ABC-type transport system substrate-binding protein
MPQAHHRSPLSARHLTRRRILRGGATAAGGILAATAFACSTKSGRAPAAGGTTSATQGTPKPGGTFNAFLPFNAPLDPQKASAQPQRVVAGVYNRLFRFKAAADSKVINNHDLENELGVSAETVDGVTWTVKLRPGAKFANTPPVNGHPVEAEDIKATFTRILDPATSSPNRAQLGMIDAAQIQTPDKSTVVFKLKLPYAPFSKTLASPAYSLILPREALAGSYDPSKVVIGSGPFTFESFATSPTPTGRIPSTSRRACPTSTPCTLPSYPTPRSSWPSSPPAISTKTDRKSVV